MQLLSEIKIHKTLHHQFVVEFDSVFEDANFVYIILELCINKVQSLLARPSARWSRNASDSLPKKPASSCWNSSQVYSTCTPTGSSTGISNSATSSSAPPWTSRLEISDLLPNFSFQMRKRGPCAALPTTSPPKSWRAQWDTPTRWTSGPWASSVMLSSSAGRPSRPTR
jgi:hypothetical protein